MPAMLCFRDFAMIPTCAYPHFSNTGGLRLLRSLVKFGENLCYSIVCWNGLPKRRTSHHFRWFCSLYFVQIRYRSEKCQSFPQFRLCFLLSVSAC